MSDKPVIGSLDERIVTGERPYKRPSTRWAIQIVYASGDVAYLRQGRVIGQGPIVQFHSKSAANAKAEEIDNGFEAGDTLNVVRYRKGFEG
jgi:hypothetical protein